MPKAILPSSSKDTLFYQPNADAQSAPPSVIDAIRAAVKGGCPEFPSDGLQALYVSCGNDMTETIRYINQWYAVTE